MELKMTTSLTATLGAALLILSMASVAPVVAMDNGPMGTGTTKSDLESQGYTCELVSVGFWECTKSGSTTYWCDSGSCQPKPLKGGNKGKFGSIKLNNGLVFKGN